MYFQKRYSKSDFSILIHFFFKINSRTQNNVWIFDYLNISDIKHFFYKIIILKQHWEMSDLEKNSKLLEHNKFSE